MNDQSFLDFVRFRNQRAARIARLRRRGSKPCFGVFYYVGGEIFAYPEPVDEADKGGDFSHPAMDHYHYWQTLVKAIPVLKPARDVLVNYYTAFPRGRVSYNWRNDQYKVWLSPEIPKSAYPVILEEFGLQGLPSEKVWWDTRDEHYQRTDDDIEALEFILEMHDIQGIPIRASQSNKTLAQRAMVAHRKLGEMANLAELRKNQT